jgi:DNA polymerase (family 10)
MVNEKIAKILHEIAELLSLKGVSYKPAAYRKAAENLENLQVNVTEIYQKNGIRGLERIPGVGKSIAGKIEEYITKNLKRKRPYDKSLLIILRLRE